MNLDEETFTNNRHAQLFDTFATIMVKLSFTYM